MSERSLNSVERPLFHPAAHYNSPDDVLSDRRLSDAEKRVILSSWASDMYSVETCPGLRDIPGMDHPIRLADILFALHRLDHTAEPETPQREKGVPWQLGKRISRSRSPA